MDDLGGRRSNEAAPDVSKPFMSGVRSMETTHKPLLVLRSKIVVVGDSHVGKTALVKMFHSGGSDYPKKYIMTSWVDFNVRSTFVLRRRCREPPNTQCFLLS